MLVAEKMAIFFILMIVGLIIRRYGIINNENQQSLSSIVVNVGCPALIISSAVESTLRLSENELLTTLGVVLGTIIITIFFAQVLPIILGYPQNERNAIKAMTIFNNIAFMGIPIILGVYGKDAVIYLTMFILPSNFLFFSYGIYLMRNKSDFSFKKLLNPGIIAETLAILFYISKISIPSIILEPLKILGGLTTPLAMLVIGASLADLKIKELLSDIRMIIFVAIKMIIFPVIFLIILKKFVNIEPLIGACFVFLATPTGNMIAMLAALYNKDVYQLSVKEISLTTAISVITLPIVSLLASLN